MPSLILSDSISEMWDRHTKIYAAPVYVGLTPKLFFVMIPSQSILTALKIYWIKKSIEITIKKIEVIDALDSHTPAFWFDAFCRRRDC